MFESAELGHSLSKEAYEQALPGLRTSLLDAQYALMDQGGFAVVVLVNGLNAAGKGETVNLFNEWMDPRHLLTHAFDPASREELERPPLWRYWRALPPKGRIGILFDNWYTEPMAARVAKLNKKADLDQRLEAINRFEAMLSREGVVLVKLWFHLTQKAQGKRLKALAADPLTA